MTKILFVCLGNICRSPMAEGVFRHIAELEGLGGQVEVDSAGTGAWHVGAPPDPRAQNATARRGIDISMLRGRQVKPHDFERFDLILAMDAENHANLLRMAPPEHAHKVKMFLDYAPETGQREVPDPYFGHSDGFNRVLDLVEAAARGLAQSLKS